MPRSLRRESDASSYAEISLAFSVSSTHSSNSGNSDSAKGNQRRSMKQVTFSSKVKAKKTLRVQDYTQDEMEATWYNQTELDHLKLESHVALQLLKQHNKNALSDAEFQVTADLDDNDEFSWRGLEHLTREKSAQLKSIVVVQQEQQKQLAAGVPKVNPLKIAQVYAKVTRSSIRDAIKRGKQDEQQVALDAATCAITIGSPIACENRAKTLLASRKEKLRRHVTIIRTL